MCALYDMVFGEGEQAGKETEAIANARMFFRNGASMELVSASITTISKEKLEEIYKEECRD